MELMIELSEPDERWLKLKHLVELMRSLREDVKMEVLPDEFPESAQVRFVGTDGLVIPNEAMPNPFSQSDSFFKWLRAEFGRPR